MAQIFTGAKAKVTIGNSESGEDQAVGYIGGLNVNQENTLTDVDIIGQLEAGDLAETGHKINFSINYFKAVSGADGTGEEVQTAAILGLDTGATSLDSMRNQGYFNVSILNDNDTPIYYMENCKFEGGSGQVDARGVWNGTWNFRALKGYGL